MENKFFHKTDALRDSEKHGLKLQLKPEDNPSIFKEYFFLEQGLRDYHKIELFIGVALVVYYAYINELIEEYRRRKDWEEKVKNKKAPFNK